MQEPLCVSAPYPQCEVCRAWEGTEQSRVAVLPSMHVLREGASDKVDVVYVIPVADGASWGNSSEFFRKGEAAELFHLMMQRLGHNYAVIPAQLCSPPQGGTNKAQQQCVQLVLGRIAYLHPKVVVLMGEGPKNYILGLEASITKAARHVFSLELPEGEKVPCIITPDPSTQFFSKNAKDLRPALAEAYELVDSLVKGTYTEPDIGRCTIIRPEERPSNALWQYVKVLDRLEPCISLDLEWATSYRNDDTIWEEEKGGLVTVQSGGWNPTAGCYENVLVDVREWGPEELRDFFQAAFLGRTIVGSAFKVGDFQAIWVNTAEINPDGSLQRGVDILNFCRGWEDSQYVQWMQDQSKFGSGLKERAMDAFGVPDWDLFLDVELKKLPKGSDTVESVPMETLWKYALCDAHFEFRWWREKGQHLVKNIAAPYAALKESTRSFLELERIGIKIDLEGMNAYKKKLEDKVLSMQDWLDHHPWTYEVSKARVIKRETAKAKKSKKGVPFDLATVEPLNPEDVYFNSKSAVDCTLLVEYLEAQGCKPFSRTETGLAEVNDSTLPKLTKEDPSQRVGPLEDFFGVIWDQRKCREMISNFVLPFLRYQLHGWVHTTFSLSKVVTGRGCASNPNVHGMPNNDDYLENFPAPPGHCIVAFDFKTGEPCINAFLSQCPALMKCFMLGAKDQNDPNADVYRHYQSTLLGIAPADQTDAQRNQGKQPWLAGTYGQGPEAIAEKAGISVEEAEKRLEHFYQQYPELLARESENRRKLFAGETFITATGRRRTFPLHRTYPYNYNKHKHLLGYQLIRELRMSAADAETLRQAGNNDIQGPLGQIMFYVLDYIRSVRHNPGLDIADCKPFLTVHDSVFYYIPDDTKLRRRIDTLLELMTSYWLYLPPDIIKNLGFPQEHIPVLQADWKISDTLGHMVKGKYAVAGEWVFQGE